MLMLNLYLSLLRLWKIKMKLASKTIILTAVFLTSCQMPFTESETIAKTENVKEVEQGSAAPKFKLKKSSFANLKHFNDDDFNEPFHAFLLSCQAFNMMPENRIIIDDFNAKSFQDVCKKAEKSLNAQEFFVSNFTPYLVTDIKGNEQGTFTGYYEAEIKGSLKKHGKYQYPVRGLPYELSHKNYTRKEIEEGALSGKAETLFWTDSLIDKLFLQIQGSGRVTLDNGTIMHIGYAGNNEKAFTSLSSILKKEGIKPDNGYNMQGMKDCLKKHPDKVVSLTNQNERYIYFKILPSNSVGPLGALGVDLIGKRALAIDNTIYGLGFPVWLETTNPKNHRLHRLVMAQDTGAAIRGGVRGDFFWGFGDEAANMAGHMKSSGRYFFLLPKRADK